MLERCGIVYSVGDEAGRGSAEELLRITEVREFGVPRAAESCFLPELNAVAAGFEEDVLYFEFLDEVMDVDFYVVLSRHKSEAGVKALTVHHPGNPVKTALAGGRPMELPFSNPLLARSLLLRLKSFGAENGLDDFDYTYEVTHHGPSSLSRPVTFVEIGSSPSEWRLREARVTIAQAVLEVLSRGEPEPATVCAGVGGNHYASRFTQRAFSEGEAYGHIIAKYALRDLEDRESIEKMIEMAFSRSKTPVKRIVVERKSGSTPREVVYGLASRLGIEALCI